MSLFRRLAPALATIIAAAVVFALAPAETPRAGATFPGYNGKLVFENDSPPGEKVVVINPNGTSREELTGGAARDIGPVWSPDGEKIAFARGVGPAKIWIMNADGSDAHQVSPDDASDDYAPTWSHDGTKIAFTSSQDIWVMDVGGGNRTNLTDHPDWDLDPSWSPDGAKIAFTSERDGNSEIYVMNADGSSQMRLTNSGGDDYAPKWTADAARIFWSGADQTIHSIKANGTDEQTITGTGGDPAPSPDGELIAYADSGGIYTMKPDGTQIAHVPGTANHDYRPDWQPLAEPPVYAGDADCDGDADAVDALHVLRGVASLPSNADCLANANVKCDDEMTSVDALFILRHVAGLDVTLPPGCPDVGSNVTAVAFR